MRLLFVFISASALLFSACKSRNKTTITTDDGKSSVTIDTKNIQNAATDIEKKTEEYVIARYN